MDLTSRWTGGPYYLTPEQIEWTRILFKRLFEQKRKEKAMNISQEDFETLCICALRYCHGRRTYMPSLVQKIVVKHLEEFSDKTIKVMVNDCQFQRNLNLYGDECDKVDWLMWEQEVKDEQIRRTIEESEAEE